LCPRSALAVRPCTVSRLAAGRLAAVPLATPERVLLVTLHDVARALSGPRRLLALAGGRIVMDRPLQEAVDDVAASYLELLRSEVAG
jgi:hypothetical protein